MADSRAPVKVGLIGLGKMGRNHLRILSLLNDVSLQWVHDHDGDLARRLAAERSVAVANDLDAALSEVDAVVICSPTVTHGDYLQRVSDKVRHVFVEKPLTDTLDTTEKMAGLAIERGLHVQVGFIERFNPAVQQMKALLARSERVVSIDFTRTNKISSRITDVDVVTDLMIHDIDLALHLNGPVRDIFAHGALSEGMIGYASALLSHDNGRFSRIQASRITDKKMRSIQATCTDMFIDCELLRREIILSRHTGLQQEEGQPYIISAMEETIEVQPREPLLSELQAFIAACRGEDVGSNPGVAEAVAAMRICHQVKTAICA